MTSTEKITIGRNLALTLTILNAIAETQTRETAAGSPCNLNTNETVKPYKFTPQSNYSFRNTRRKRQLTEEHYLRIRQALVVLIILTLIYFFA